MRLLERWAARLVGRKPDERSIFSRRKKPVLAGTVPAGGGPL
jgi:hypothetical protein